MSILADTRKDSILICLRKISRFILFTFLIVCKLNAKAHQIDSVSSASTFIRNEGQWENPALFLYSANHTQVFFENKGLRYFFDHPEDIEAYFDHQKNPHLFNTKTIRRHAVFMEFINSEAIFPQGGEEQLAKLNFIQGNESKYWKSNVRTYQLIQYKNLYKGIDLKVYPHVMGKIRFYYSAPI